MVCSLVHQGDVHCLPVSKMGASGYGYSKASRFADPCGLLCRRAPPPLYMREIGANCPLVFWARSRGQNYKVTEKAQNADLAENRRFAQIHPFSWKLKHWKAQIFAENRRFWQKTADFRRLGSFTLGPAPLARPYVLFPSFVRTFPLKTQLFFFGRAIPSLTPKRTNCTLGPKSCVFDVPPKFYRMFETQLSDVSVVKIVQTSRTNGD